MKYYTNKICYCLLLSFLLSGFFVSNTVAQPNIEGIQIYHKNIHLSSERLLLAEDINNFHHADDLWQVLREQFSLPHYEDNPAVQEQIEWFMNHQDFLMRSANRAAPYLYYILQQAKKRNLPAEVVLLPIFESSFNPFAYSPAGAAGIWQMMPRTASGYGVKQDWWYDGRRDVIASTKAALNHIAYLSNFFDSNWLLSIAAYDTGEGNVLAAIRRNIRDGRDADFWSLPLAQETREYVPRLLALATIIAHPERYPVYLPPVRNAPYLAQMDVGAQIDLKHAADLAGLSLKKLIQLNPGYNRTITDPNGPYKLVVPIENVEQFSQNLATTPMFRKVGFQHYKVKFGDTVASVSRTFNVSPAVVRKLNRVATNKLKPGTKLVLPYSVPALSKAVLAADNEPIVAPRVIKAPTSNPTRAVESFFNRAKSAFTSARRVPDEIEVNAGQYSIQPGDTIYMTREGDTVDRVAKHFQIPSKALIAANPLGNGHQLVPGAKLVIPTHLVTHIVPENTTDYDVSPGDTIYTVRAGDTMEMIAHKFHTTPPAIRVSNLLASDEVREGDRILIPARV